MKIKQEIPKQRSMTKIDKAVIKTNQQPTLFLWICVKLLFPKNYIHNVETAD